MRWPFGLDNLFRPKAPAAVAVRPSSGAGMARPTYLSNFTGVSTFGALPRPQEFELLRQFHRSLPELGQAVNILASFVGVPQFVVGDDPKNPASEELNRWAQEVRYGSVGYGLGQWITDHLSQALLYGFSVGEAVADRQRRDVARLWAYLSPSFGFQADAEGLLTAVQSQPGRGLVPLDPVTTLLTVHRPQGCEPHGTSLFFASGTFTQVWLETVYAYREGIRRQGIPTYHVHTALPKDLNDPTGTISQAVLNANIAGWEAAVGSQKDDGQAQDFFTVSVGETTVKAIGGDLNLPDLDNKKRPIVEEVVTATGIPPFMLGLHWSTTERLSQQQADLLTTNIDTLRSLEEPSIRKAVDLRQRLGARRNALEYEIKWSDVTLNDLEATARAALQDAQAQESRLRYAERCWQIGFWNQRQAAEYATGSDAVAVALESPPGMTEPELDAPESSGDAAARALVASGNGRH